MNMQRYFVAPEQFAEASVTITGDDAHHITRVMRGRVGDIVICSDGESREAKVEITAIGQGSVEASIVEMIPMTQEAAVDVWIAQSLPKGDKLETVIQKCTEIGASRFVPFISERTVVQYDDKKEAKRLERWNKIAKEAAEQAHRNRVPRVDASVSWKRLLELIADVDAAYFCYEKQSAQQFRELLGLVFAGNGQTEDKAADPDATTKAERRKKLLLIVGPEGGFTENEVLQAEAAGAKAVGLGKRILRTETAAMVGLTCILYESGEMGGR